MGGQPAFYAIPFKRPKNLKRSIMSEEGGEAASAADADADAFMIAGVDMIASGYANAGVKSDKDVVLVVYMIAGVNTTQLEIRMNIRMWIQLQLRMRWQM